MTNQPGDCPLCKEILPAAVKAALMPKYQLKWLEAYKSSITKGANDDLAATEAWETVAKSEGCRSFGGWISVEVVDCQGDVVDAEGLHKAAERFIARGGPIQDFHSNRPVGAWYAAKVAVHPSGKKGVYAKGVIFQGERLYDRAWKAIKEKKVDGLSIGGDAIRQYGECNHEACYNKIKDLHLFEVSLVDEPACGPARIDEVNEKAKGVINKSVEKGSDKFNFERYTDSAFAMTGDVLRNLNDASAAVSDHEHIWREGIGVIDAAQRLKTAIGVWNTHGMRMFDRMADAKKGEDLEKRKRIPYQDLTNYDLNMLEGMMEESGWTSSRNSGWKAVEEFYMSLPERDLGEWAFEKVAKASDSGVREIQGYLDQAQTIVHNMARYCRDEGLGAIATNLDGIARDLERQSAEVFRSRNKAADEHARTPIGSESMIGDKITKEARDEAAALFKQAEDLIRQASSKIGLKKAEDEPGKPKEEVAGNDVDPKAEQESMDGAIQRLTAMMTDVHREMTAPTPDSEIEKPGEPGEVPGEQPAEGEAPAEGAEKPAEAAEVPAGDQPPIPPAENPPKAPAEGEGDPKDETEDKEKGAITEATCYNLERSYARYGVRIRWRGNGRAGLYMMDDLVGEFTNPDQLLMAINDQIELYGGKSAEPAACAFCGTMSKSATCPGCGIIKRTIKKPAEAEDLKGKLETKAVDTPRPSMRSEGIADDQIAKLLRDPKRLARMSYKELDQLAPRE